MVARSKYLQMTNVHPPTNIMQYGTEKERNIESNYHSIYFVHTGSEFTIQLNWLHKIQQHYNIHKI